LLGNVKDTLDAGLPSIREKTDPSYLSEALRDYKKTRLDLDALAESSPHSDIIHPQYITRLVSELTAEDAIFTCDGGGDSDHLDGATSRSTARGALSGRSITDRWLMRCGSRSAHGRRIQVISMSGDGGFSMMMANCICAQPWLYRGRARAG
jgi:pyruvate dehydrogenase (quinone)